MRPSIRTAGSQLGGCCRPRRPGIKCDESPLGDTPRALSRIASAIRAKAQSVQRITGRQVSLSKSAHFHGCEKLEDPWYATRTGVRLQFLKPVCFAKAPNIARESAETLAFRTPRPHASPPPLVPACTSIACTYSIAGQPTLGRYCLACVESGSGLLRPRAHSAAAPLPALSREVPAIRCRTRIARQSNREQCGGPSLPLQINSGADGSPSRWKNSLANR